MKRINRCLENP